MNEFNFFRKSSVFAQFFFGHKMRLPSANSVVLRTNDVMLRINDVALRANIMLRIDFSPLLCYNTLKGR
jgi:hypothetical protein